MKITCSVYAAPDPILRIDTRVLEPLRWSLGRRHRVAMNPQTNDLRLGTASLSCLRKAEIVALITVVLEEENLVAAVGLEPTTYGL